MPSIEEHLGQAEHNEKLLSAIDPKEFGDWAMTLVFYTALHHVDAVLASRNIHPGRHEIRDAEVSKKIELRPIATQYFRLKTRSRNARYNCVRFQMAEVSRAQKDDLGAIKKELGKYFQKGA